MTFARLAILRLGGARRAGVRALSSAAGTSGKMLVRGVNLFYRTNGDTGLPMICMPGAMGTADTDFGPQLRDLADTMQVVSFDPRGSGQSQPPERDFPLDFYQQDANDAAALMAALGHSKYAVMGWSDGAISAVMLAAAHAPKVDRLIIFGGNAFFTKDDIDAFEQTRDVAANWSRRQKDTHYPTYGAEKLQRMWGAAIDAWAGMYAANDGDVCMAQARTIKCPTLVLHGAKDPICLREHPEWFAANIPGDGNTRLHSLPDGKHNLHLRFADEVNALVRDFVSSSKDAKMVQEGMRKKVAPDDSLAGVALNVQLTVDDVDRMIVSKLKDALLARGLDTSGLKPALAGRLNDALS